MSEKDEGQTNVEPVAEGGGVDWGEMNDGVDPGHDDGNHEDIHGDVGGGEPPAAAPAPAPTPAPAPAPAAKDPTDPNAEPAEEPGEPQEPSAETPEEAPVPQELTPEQIEARKQQYEAWRKSEVERLTGEYQFSPEEAAALQTEPETVLPKLAADLTLRVREQVIQEVLSHLPNVIGQVTVSQTRDQKAAEAFFTAHPDLQKYAKDITPAAAEFRRRNPKATPQQVIDGAARMVRAIHNLPMPAAGSPVPTPAPAPAASKRSAPHKPAATGGRGAAPKQPEQNVWADLAGDDD